MKLKVTATANAVAILGAIYFVGCYLIAWTWPEMYKSFASSWMHMINLEGLWKSGPSNFISGMVSFTGVSWLTGYLFAVLYNKLAK